MNKSFFDWSQSEYSYLPWRKHRTLYKTLVSEIMLQQTNVSTVLKHFEAFLKVFPNIRSLAIASEEEVCAHWQGLGYYRRARNLRNAALTLVENFKGKFPQEYSDLVSIPGIGAYTANALIAIGRNEPALALDANLERVLARLYGIKEEKGAKLLKAIESQQEAILKDFKVKKYGARAVNESLMDLGRVYCQAKKADCLLCPLKGKCFVFQNKEDALTYPINKHKNKKMYELKLLRLIVREKKQVLGYVKDQKEWLTGQVEIPSFILSCEDEKLQQYPKIQYKEYEKASCQKSAITKYKIMNYVLELSKKEFDQLLKENGLNSEIYSFYSTDTGAHHFSTTTIKCFNVK